MTSALLLLVPLLQAAGQTDPAPEPAPAPAAVEKPATPPGKGGRVAIIRIVGSLDLVHVALVKRAVKEIKADPPDLVLFEIDTPGGRIDYMLELGEEMMSLDPIPTAAYVRPIGGGDMIAGAAWSAGSFLAFSCKRIFMHPGTVIGAAAAVNGATGEVLPEKYISAFREKFRARARQNGYPENLAVAMVDQDLEVFEVEHEGKRLYLTEGEIEKMKKDGAKIEKPAAPFIAKGKLLTMTDQQVADSGMGKIVNGRPALYSECGLAGPVERAFETTWSEELVSMLTGGWVSTILLIVGILGIWVEFKTPGFGAAGAVGVIALGLFLFGHHLVGLAEIPEILLIVVGIVLILVEVLFLPGTFVFAVTGACSILAGLILSFQGFTIPSPVEAPWQVGIFMSSLGRVILGFLGAAAGLIVAMRFLPKAPVVLGAQITATAPAPSGVSDPDLTGRKGHAVTPLVPGGKAEIDGQVHDVMADGEFVAEGEPIKVLRIEDFRIIVGREKR